MNELLYNMALLKGRNVVGTLLRPATSQKDALKQLVERATEKIEPVDRGALVRLVRNIRLPGDERYIRKYSWANLRNGVIHSFSQ